MNVLEVDMSRPFTPLRSLGALIRKSSLRYSNEFIWQDVTLTEEFQDAYSTYLEDSGYEIEFFESTAVITTSQSRYIFVPNQWFVIASYVVDIYEELYRYKELFIEVARFREKALDVYVKTLRDSTTSHERNAFYKDAEQVFSRKITDSTILKDTIDKVWRFATDYSWWSGQKTLDRTDFHMSVILNLLNLVNASQGFVADITSAYANNKHLRHLVRNVDGFTINLSVPENYKDSEIAEENHYNCSEVHENDVPYVKDESENNKKPHIKITENKVKVIKYKNRS